MIWYPGTKSGFSSGNHRGVGHREPIEDDVCEDRNPKDGIRWRCLFVSLFWLMAWVAVTFAALVIGLWVASWVAGRM